MADLQTALATAIQSWNPTETQVQNTTQPAATPAPAPATSAPADHTHYNPIDHVRLEKQPGGRIYFAPTNNVTRETFNFVKENPGTTAKEARAILSARGFNPSSIGSIMAQLVNNKVLVRSVGNKYYPAVDEYRPLKRNPAKALGKKPAPSRTKAEKPVATKTPVVEVLASMVAAPAPVVPAEFSAEQFVDGLTLRQARQVYEHLRSIFAAI